jgi:CRISPR-associated protein Cmr1
MEEKSIVGHLYQLRGSNVFNDLVIVAALASRWGGLGAKTQHGWGVVEVFFKDKYGNAVPIDIDSFVRRFVGDTQNDKGFPSLGNLFFARLYLNVSDDNWWNDPSVKLGEGAKDSCWRLNKGFSVPIPPAVKYRLRFGRAITTKTGKKLQVPIFDSLRSRDQNTYVFGSLNPNCAAKINISNAYKEGERWQFRLWGWLPQQGNQFGINRDRLVAELHKLVTIRQPFWDSIFGPGLVALNETEWREVDRIGHGRNLPSIVPSPTTNAEFLRGLLV